MQVFFEGEIRGVKENVRTDETGLEKKKYRTFIENEVGERLELNCNRDYSHLKGKSGVAKINVYDREGGGYWLTLDEFVGASIE